MTDLVTIISSGPGTSKHVEKVVYGMPWGKAFIIITKGMSLPFAAPANSEVISIDFSLPIQEAIETIVESLKPKISGTEVGLNLISGDGKEHMAIISAVLKCGVGFRMVALTKEGVIEV